MKEPVVLWVVYLYFLKYFGDLSLYIRIRSLISFGNHGYEPYEYSFTLGSLFNLFKGSDCIYNMQPVYFST